MKHGTGAPHCRARIAVVQVLLRIYTILEQESWLLTDGAVIELPKLARQFHELYNVLAAESLRALKKGWKMVPTMHLFLHLFEWVVPDNKLNPRTYWCYADEDTVGTLVEIARSCHVDHVAPLALLKWLLLSMHEISCSE